MEFTCEVSYKRIQKRKRKNDKKKKRKETGSNAKRQGVLAENLSSIARLVFGLGSFILHCLHGARSLVRFDFTTYDIDTELTTCMSKIRNCVVIKPAWLLA